MTAMKRALLGAAALFAAHSLPAAAQSPVAPGGYKLAVFASSATLIAPDSVITEGGHVWIGYGNGAAPDGSSGTSLVVEFAHDGSIIRTLTFPGHNDGLRMDPYSHTLWVLQNEDAMPTLIVVDPATGLTKSTQTLRPINGGGYDDAAFIGHRIYVSASNPSLDAKGVNRHPALVAMTPTEHGLVPETVLSGDSLAIDAITHEAVRLNLTDPDSLTVTPTGNLLLDDQGDSQLIELQFHAGTGPFIRRIPLAGGVQVDDTVFATGNYGTLFISDTKANVVYSLTSKLFHAGRAYTASTGVAATPTTPAVPAFVGELYLDSGATAPLVTGLVAPHGLAFRAD